MNNLTWFKIGHHLQPEWGSVSILWLIVSSLLLVMNRTTMTMMMMALVVVILVIFKTMMMMKITMTMLMSKKDEPEQGDVKAMTVVVVARVHLNLVHTVRLHGNAL